MIVVDAFQVGIGNCMSNYFKLPQSQEWTETSKTNRSSAKLVVYSKCICFALHKTTIYSRNNLLTCRLPLSSAWPHLNSDVGLEKGNINRTVSVL